MLNALRLTELDLSTVDPRTLTPAEWDAVKREVARRARTGRSQLVRDLVGRLAAPGAAPRESADPAATCGARLSDHAA